MNSKIIEEFYQFLLIEKNYSKNTIDSYMRNIKQFIEVNKDIDLLQINEQIVNDYLIFLRENFDNNTVIQKISSLRSLYKFLLQENYVKENLFSEISLGKKNVILPKFLTIDEINNFLDSIPLDSNLNIRNKAMFEVLYSTGVRISELLNIKINDINFNEDLINIFGKGKKERIVPLNKTAKKYLLLYLNESRIHLLKDDTDLLFVNKNGKKISRQGFTKILKTQANLVGITDISPHKIRHSIATHMLNNGADLKVVQELLGHENIATTEIYTHVSQQQLIDDYNKYHKYGNKHND